MKRAFRWIGFAAFAAFLALAAGCAAPNYVYKPNPVAAGAGKLPVKVAVLPFQDGTENFTKRGSALGDGQYNLAKAGISGGMTAMPPEFWGKSFADELAASGSFQSARFLYSPAEAARDEDYLVDGTLKKVIFAATFDYPNELLVSFRATRKSDRKVVWKKEPAGREKPEEVYAGCGMGMQCLFDKCTATGTSGWPPSGPSPGGPRGKPRVLSKAEWGEGPGSKKKGGLGNSPKK